MEHRGTPQAQDGARAVLGCPRVSDYNYSTFDLAREQPVFAAFKTKRYVTQRVQSNDLEDLATGQTLPMSDLWAKGLAVVEFGSLT